MKMSVLTSFCSGMAAAGAFFSRKNRVENIQGQCFGKIAKNMEKVQNMASSTKGRASRAPFAGHFVYFLHICCNFSKKLALDVSYMQPSF